MPRLKLTIEYDGTDYVGWQVQPNGRSIQSELERALAGLLKEPVRVMGAGRTDAGVHAEGQVASFRTDKALPLKAYVLGLASLLPEDIGVVHAEEVDDAFDPRRWSMGKRYRYQIWNGPVRSPLRRRTHWQLFGPLDVESMVKAASHLVGRHDFSAFRASDCAAKHAVREITAIDVRMSEGDLSIAVDGTAFLKHMVRNLVGTLVEVGKGKEAPEWVRAVLESKDRNEAGQTAPAHGLTLAHVKYSDPLGPRERVTAVNVFEDE